MQLMLIRHHVDAEKCPWKLQGKAIPVNNGCVGVGCVGQIRYSYCSSVENRYNIKATQNKYKEQEQ